MLSRDNFPEVIKVLRFPLIIGVVLIHAYLYSFDIVSGEYGYTVMGGIQYLLAQILGGGCTAAFFCFSGFLFFYKLDMFSSHIYVQKIKRRLKTLIIPYIVWNLLFLFAYSMAQTFFPNMMHGGLVQGIDKALYQYTLFDWVTVLFGSSHFRFPCNFPLWYIRDLFIVMLCTPVLYVFLKEANGIRKYLGMMLIVVLGILWLLKIGEGIPQTMAFFFFCIGAYFSINQKPIIPQKKAGVILTVVLALLVLFQMVFPAYDYVTYINRIGRIVEVFVMIFWVSQLLHYKPINTDNIWFKSSFLIYVGHVFPLISIQRMLFKIVPTDDNQYYALFVYLGSTIITVMLIVLINKLIHKYIPKISAFILGER